MVKSNIGNDLPSRLISRLRLRQLHLLSAVATGLSFRQAADQMALSQPAVSKMARELESVIGYPVFERHTESVKLTPLGHSLAHYARLALQQIAGIDESLRAYSSGQTHKLRIGAPSYTAVSLLAVPVAQLVARYPAARVEIIDGTAVRLHKALANGELDLIVGSLPAAQLSDNEANLLNVEVLYPDEVTFIVAEDSPLAQRTASLADLVNYSWVTPQEDSLLRSTVRGVMLEAGLTMPTPVIQTSLVPPIGAIVAEEPTLIGLLRLDAAHYMSGRLKLKVLEVEPRMPLPPVAILTLRSISLPPLGSLLLQHIRQRVGQLFHDTRLPLQALSQKTANEFEDLR